MIFKSYNNDAEFSEHLNEAQWEIVLDGEIQLKIDGTQYIFPKGMHILFLEILSAVLR